jgi:L-lactate dehydrogenase complex protein LldG
MTNPIIESICRSLGREAGDLSGPRPVVLAPRRAGPAEAEIERFLGEVRSLSGVGERLGPEGFPKALEALVSGERIRKATLWRTPLLERLGLESRLRVLGVGLVSPNADKNKLASCDLGVTEADYLLPETGTLVLRSSDEKPRLVSLLPRVHLALVAPRLLRADLHQVFTEVKGDRYLVFITGPSRTADIELTVTLGVHGPRSLYVWVLDEGG